MANGKWKMTNGKWFLIFAIFLCSPFVLRAVSSQVPDATPPPSASPSPSPSPSPTPVTGLHQWGAVTLFHGMPSDRVHAIEQASDGSMWFGTEAGLAKFDGRRTQTINDPAVPGGRVLALKVDHNRVLWIGTENGAARLVNGRFEAIPQMAGKVVTAIVEADNERVLMATEQGQVYESKPIVTDASRAGRVTQPAIEVRALLDQPLQSADREHPGPLQLTSVTISQGSILAGSLGNGLLQLQNGGAKGLHTRPSFNFIRALETDSDGNLWVGTRARKDEPSLYRGSDPSKLTKLDAPTGTVTTIQSAGNGVWVGTDGNGVFHYSSSKKMQRFTFDGTAGGLRSDHVYSIFVDAEDVVWFGTDRGACRYDGHAPRAEPISENPESNFVRSLYQTSNGQLLAGTNRGLFAYDNTAAVWRTVGGLDRNIIYCVAEDKNGRLLIGSASGFYIAQKPGDVFEQTFTRAETGSGNADAIGSIRAIAQFRDATYIASYGRGFERLEDGRPHLIWPGASGGTRDVISLLAEGDSRVLIGTTKEGVLSFDGREVQTDQTFTSLKGMAVRSIERTNDGTLWFATSRGVYYCRPTGECLVAAPEFDARALLVNRQTNEVWCATTGGGLLKILIDNTVGPVVSQLDVEQGLPSQNVFAVWVKNDPQPVVFIGTSRGVVRYEPGRLSPTLFATRTISKRVHPASELETGLSLEYPQNSLLLEVAAISSRTFPEQFQYAFVLTDGSGKLVKQKLSREAQFAMEALHPGKYRVTARAFTKDLVASSPLTFEFTVARAPFPWTSTALAVLLAIALVALLWAILERRKIVATSAALVDANRNLADARLNLANEAERERRRIARDLHDQTLADLRHLMLVADQLKPNGNQEFDPGVMRREIESISHEVRRICEDLSPSVLQNVGFAAALEFALANAVQHAPPEKRFKYDFTCEEGLDEKAKLPANVQMQIYRIVQEAITNICRHSGASKVLMDVRCSAGADFTLTIEDDGRPFDITEGNKRDGRGVANMRARASLIEAEISWARGAAGGTCFLLRRPQANVRFSDENRIRHA